MAAKTPLGFQQITSLGSAVGLTVPRGASLAIVQCTAQNVRWRDDGSNPTTTVGMLLVKQDTASGDEALYYDGNLTQIKFIEVTGGAVLNVSYYDNC